MNRNRTWAVGHAKSAPFGLSLKSREKHDFWYYSGLQLLELVLSFILIKKSCILLIMSKSSSRAKVRTFFVMVRYL